MRDGLRAIDQRLGPCAVRQGHDLLDGHHRTERVRHLRDGHDPGAVVQELLVFIQQHLARVVHRDHAQLGALGRRKLLPGHDVGVVLQVADDDLVALADVLRAPALGHEVDGLGGAAHKDHFVHIGRVDELLHALAGAFVGVGGACGQFMGSAVDVGVLVLIEVRDAINHRLRLVRGGRVVKPHQLAAVHALGEHGKVAANGMHVKRRMLALPGQGHRGVRRGLGRGDIAAG